MDVSCDNGIDVVTTVPALVSGAVHEGGTRANVIGADRPFARITRDFTKENKDVISGRKLELLGFNPPVSLMVVFGGIVHVSSSPGSSGVTQTSG